MPMKIFIILLSFFFLAELAVMIMFEPLISQLPPLSAGLFDACVLTLLLAPPLWLLCSRAPEKGSQKTSDEIVHIGGLSLFCQLLLIAFAVEFLIMLSLPAFFPGLTGKSLALLDASLTILFILPILWWKLVHAGEHLKLSTVADFLSSPVMLYGTLLYTVFVADMVQEIVQPYLTPAGFDTYFILIDSTLTTALVAPFLWLLVGRPLIKAAQSERTRARSILDQVVDAVVTFDAKGRISLTNPAAQKAFGYTLEELVGQPLDMLFAEPQLNIQQHIATDFRDKTGAPKIMFREMLCIDRSGLDLTMNISLSRVVQHGHEEWLMILQDISQHKQAEKALRERDERFREVFEQSDDAIAFFKPHSCSIIDVNVTFAELFGYSKTEIKKQGLDYLVGPEDLSRVSNAIKETGQGPPVTIGDFIGFRSDSTQFTLSLRSKLMTIDGISIIFCSFRDITNRLRLEKEAKEIQAKLIQTNKMTALGQMVSGVAHEINNPNNFIITNSRLLASTWEDNHKILNEYYREHGDFCLGNIPFSELDKHAPQLFAGILEGSGRINEIVKNLKNFYRPERATKAGIDINKIAASAVSLLHHEIVNFTKNFHRQLEDELPTFTGNSQQIGQVVINLLMNACQALPDKDRGIWMATGYDAETSQVTLTIRDEGRGMTPAESRRVMEPFFTTKLDEGGTGLGLTICKSIIREHEGTLEFESTPGKGSSFVVRLPAAPPVTKD